MGLGRVSVSIARREWLAALVMALVATALMQIPYALGYAFAPRDAEYTGLLINSEDYSYHAIMLQGYNGAWAYHIQYTTEPHGAAFLYGFYLSLGHLARTLGISIIAMWHAARVLAAFVMLVAAFAFSALFLVDPQERWTAYLIAIFGSGFDWILFPWERFDPTASTPLDFRMPEVHLFFTGLTYPHIALGIALVLGAFWLLLRYLERKFWRDIFLLTIAVMLIGIIYPFLIFLVAGVLGASWVYHSTRAKKVLWRDAFALGLALVPSAPLYLYYAYVLQSNSVFRVWNDQAVTLSPNPLHYLFAYGALLALAAPILMSSRSLQERNFPPLSREVGGISFEFLILWLFVVALLLYAPLGAQRRFVQGVQIPLAILASAGLYRIWLPRLENANWFQRLAARPNYSVLGLRRLVVILLLLGLSAANWVVLVKLSTLTAIEQPAAFFVPRTQVAAIDWLGTNVQRDAPILAAYWTSGYIPARTGNLVFMGQRYETSHFEEKRALVENFFDSKTDDVFRRDLLARYRIGYMFWGEQERALGTFDPARADYLDFAFSNSAVTIYRVK